MGDVTNEVNTGVVQQAVPTLETPQDTATVNQAVPAPETPKDEVPGWLQTTPKQQADEAVAAAIAKATEAQKDPLTLQALANKKDQPLDAKGFPTVGKETITPATPDEDQRAAVQKAIDALKGNPTGTAPPTEPTAK